jgi:hypothetical protein
MTLGLSSRNPLQKSLSYGTESPRINAGFAKFCGGNNQPEKVMLLK